MSSRPSATGDPNPGERRRGRVLVVDDEIVIQALLSEILTEDGYEVVTADDGGPAIELLERDRFDLVISDIVMPTVNGVEVLLAAKRADPECPVVMITGYPSADTVVRLVNLGASDYISKPFNLDLIKLTVAKLIQMRKVRQATRQVDTGAQLATIDRDTDTYNLMLFTRLLESEVARSRWRGHSCSLLMAEIDDLADYSGNGNAEAMDDYVKMLADVVKSESRPGDIIGRTDVAELAMILPETGPEDAVSLGERMRKQVARQFSVSIGVSSLSPRSADAEGLVRNARAAKHAAIACAGDAIYPLR